MQYRPTDNSGTKQKTS